MSQQEDLASILQPPLDLHQIAITAEGPAISAHTRLWNVFVRIKERDKDLHHLSSKILSVNMNIRKYDGIWKSLPCVTLSPKLVQNRSCSPSYDTANNLSQLFDRSSMKSWELNLKVLLPALGEQYISLLPETAPSPVYTRFYGR